MHVWRDIEPELSVGLYLVAWVVTYGPLIKSGNRAIIRTARCCEGFPIYRLKLCDCRVSIDSIAST